MYQLRLHVHHAILKHEAIPELGPALRRMAPHPMISMHHPWVKALLREAHLQTEYHRAWLWGEQPREGTCHVQLLFLIKQMEEGRGVYREHASVQRVERSQTAQIRNWNRGGGRGRIARGGLGPVGSSGSRHDGTGRRDDFEVLRVEDVTRDERYRVSFLRRSEEFMPEVREFCK